MVCGPIQDEVTSDSPALKSKIKNFPTCPSSDRVCRRIYSRGSRSLTGSSGYERKRKKRTCAAMHRFCAPIYGEDMMSRFVLIRENLCKQKKFKNSSVCQPSDKVCQLHT